MYGNPYGPAVTTCDRAVLDCEYQSGPSVPGHQGLTVVIDVRCLVSAGAIPVPSLTTYWPDTSTARIASGHFT
ncbi:hypothetical protein RRG08_009517 [Elysia crispata]|uniref:Uncharacterized protein n=1 Tax=Elysia crispata TaxID=231223 RepID=A0AAE1E996_9GAST|nr:hypothetical protein RRG08_009517 [Elysia crispata]